MTGWVLAIVAVIAVIAGVVLNRFGVIDLSDKSRRAGSYSGVLGSFDELFSPNKYEIQLAQDRETVLPAPAPVAGDGDKGVYGGRVRIDL